MKAQTKFDLNADSTSKQPFDLSQIAYKFELTEIDDDQPLGHKTNAIFLSYRNRWLCID